MFLLYNLTVIALALVLVLAIAGAASRPQPIGEDMASRDWVKPLPTHPYGPRDAGPTGSTPASTMPVVRAAGLQ